MAASQNEIESYYVEEKARKDSGENKKLPTTGDSTDFAQLDRLHLSITPHLQDKFMLIFPLTMWMLNVTLMQKSRLQKSADNTQKQRQTCIKF